MKLLLLVTLSFLLTIGSVYAQDSVILEPVEDRIIDHTDRFVTFNVIATNTQDTADDFRLLIDGTHLEWAFPSHFLIHLEPLEPKQLSLDLYPRFAAPGEYIFKFELTSDKTGITESVPLYLEIKEPFTIDAFDVLREGNQLKTAFAYDTSKKQDVDIFVHIKDLQGTEILTVKFTETIDGEQTITKYIDLPNDILAGDYIIDVDFVPYSVGDLKTETKQFNVAPIHNVVESESRLLTPMYEEITIEVTNDGNIDENDYQVYQSVRSDLLTGHITRPNECTSKSGQTTCQYRISLAPGETRSISYRIEFWPFYVQGLVILLIVLAVVGYSYTRVTAPTIKKMARKKGNQKYSITLHIKNPFRHNLRGVMVRDWISPLADITPEFSMKPVARKSEAGTELLWNIGNIKPNDEVLINYTIKASIEGNIKLPKAHVRFFDKAGNQNKIFSNSLEIE